MDSSLMVVGAGGVCLAVLIVLAVVAVVFSARQERERRAALQRWADRQGWRMVYRPDVAWGARLPGRNRRSGVSLALFGTMGGLSVAVGEYSYTKTTHNSGGRKGTTSTTYRYVVTVVRLGAPRPAVAVHRRGGLSKLWRSMFGDRATAIGHEVFDREFRVTAADPSQVRAVLSGPLVEAHLAGQVPDWSVEGHELLTVREGRIGDPEAIPAQVAPLRRVAELLQR